MKENEPEIILKEISSSEPKAYLYPYKRTYIGGITHMTPIELKLLPVKKMKKIMQDGKRYTEYKIVSED